MANRKLSLFQSQAVPIRLVDINGDETEFSIAVSVIGGGGSGEDAAQIQGNTPVGSAPLGNPVYIGTVDGDGNVQNLQSDPVSAGLYVTPLSTQAQVFENTASVLLSNAARTVTNSSIGQTNSTGRGVLLLVSVTNAGTGSITPGIGVLSSISGNYFTIWTAGTPLTTNGDYAYLLYPGASGGSYTEVVPSGLARDWRLTVTHNNANSITYGAIGFLMI